MKTRYKKVLLCMPPSLKFHGTPSIPTSGLGYLSESLSENNIENEVIDMRLGYNLQDLKNKIKQFKPDLIGFSAFSFHHDVPYSLISSVKSKDYGIIIGGPHVSTIGKKILEETEADYSLRYEGEKILVDLCKGKPLEEIDGLIYKKDNKIIENPNTTFLDINKLPFPKYKNFELNKYLKKEISIITSRGCPYNCIFCSTKDIMGKPVRMKLPKKVVGEIKYWYDLGYRKFGINDDNFTFNRQRVFDICEEIKKSGMKGLNFICGNGVRADKLDREILTAMKSIGFTELAIGVEVGNNKMLKIIKKGETIEQIENAIKISTEMGFYVTLNFIIGFPKETESDIKDSMNMALKYPINGAYFLNPIPYKNTELYEYLKKNNLFRLKNYLNTLNIDATEPIFETPELPLEKRKELMRLAKKIERKIIKKSFVRRMKKFGIFSNIFADLIFFRPFYNFILEMNSKFKFIKKILIYFTKKYDLRNMETLRK